jgi:hypothetical protein
VIASSSAQAAPLVSGAKKMPGELVQMNASHHDWFESRGPWYALMIDDATCRTFVRFLRAAKGGGEKGMGGGKGMSTFICLLSLSRPPAVAWKRG